MMLYRSKAFELLLKLVGDWKALEVAGWNVSWNGRLWYIPDMRTVKIADAEEVVDHFYLCL